jgi:hypothetical protein
MRAMDDGGPAFPTMDSRELDHAPSLLSPGMSLRDYFADSAMKGMLAHPDTDLKKKSTPTTVAAWAYEQADAMLAERVKPVPK